MKIAVLFAMFAGLSCPAVFAAGRTALKELFAQSPASADRLKIETPAQPAGPRLSEVPQDLIDRFRRTAGGLGAVERATAWTYADLDRLEGDARRIGQGVYLPFFENDLRDMSFKMSGWANDVRRLAADVKELLALAQKSPELNRSALDIGRSARDILDRFQFRVQNSADRLEWTVKGVNPALIGYGAQWTAMDISRNSRDIQWADRDLYFNAQTLAEKTSP